MCQTLQGCYVDGIDQPIQQNLNKNRATFNGYGFYIIEGLLLKAGPLDFKNHTFI